MAYGVENVVGGMNRSGPSYWPTVLARTYIEHQRLRQFIHDIKTPRDHWRHGAEFGCGYGRMAPVLTEFCTTVVAFERDAELAEIAKQAIGGISDLYVHHVKSLEQVPQGPTGSFDLILTYTVLQHMPDDECSRVMAEIKRTLAPHGLLVCVEDTHGERGGNVWPRVPERYADMLGMKLILQAPRIIEDNRNVGTMMAFV